MNNKTLIILMILIFPNLLFGQNNIIDSLQNTIQNSRNDSVKIISYIEIAKNFSKLYKKDTSLIYFNKAEQLSKRLSESKDKKEAEIGKILLASSLYYKSHFFYTFSELNKSEETLNKTLEITKSVIRNSDNKYHKIKAMKINAKVYMEIANIYIDKGYYKIALKNTFESQQITDSLIQKGKLPEKESAVQYFYLGLINFYLKNYEKSLAYYKKSMQISQKFQNQTGILNCYQNIGIVETKLNRIDTALMYFNKTLDYLKKNKDPITEAQTYDNMADCYMRLKNYKKAELYLAKALIITQKLNNKVGLIYIMTGLTDLYIKTGKYDKALIYATKALKIAEKIESISMKKEIYLYLSKIFEHKNNYKKALNYHKLYKELEDSIFNKEKNRQIQESEAKYQANKKQEEINRQKIEIAKRDSKIKIKQNQNYIFAVVVVSLIIILVIIIITLKQKQKINNLIRKQNKRITDSIKYAEKIQKAALPSATVLKQLFKEHFVLFKPLQIVSGDFYWAIKKDNFILFAVADCTGHGIPGAFVSMLGISFLNELSLIANLTRPDTILEEMRFILKKSFRNDTSDLDTSDGIDISLCSINTETDELFFAGANNSAFIYRKNEVIELNATPNPVGVYYKEVMFKMQKIKLQKDDVIYLYSDGYADQFGGKKHKPQKFTLKRFKDLLSEIHPKPLAEQKEILEENFETWKKDNEQTDDILIFGIKY